MEKATIVIEIPEAIEPSSVRIVASRETPELDFIFACHTHEAFAEPAEAPAVEPDTIARVFSALCLQRLLIWLRSEIDARAGELIRLLDAPRPDRKGAVRELLVLEGACATARQELETHEGYRAQNAQVAKPGQQVDALAREKSKGDLPRHSSAAN